MTLDGAKTSWRILAVVLVSVAACVARGAEPTAFEVLKESARYVAEDVKGKVLQIRSEKSADGLKPGTWFILYYDTHVRTRETELRFENGKKVDVRQPFRLFARTGLSSNVLDSSKLKIDSNVALKTAQKDRLLEKLKLTNSRLILEKWEDAPVWKITFWAEKMREPGKMVEIGNIFVNAEDSKVVHRDLYLERAE